MKRRKVSQKIIQTIFWVAAVIVVAQTPWMRQLLLIWIATALPFLSLPWIGCVVSARYPKLRGTRNPLLAVAAPVPLAVSSVPLQSRDRQTLYN